MLCEIHDHDVIIDSGYHVCIKCGLCVDQVYAYPTFQEDRTAVFFTNQNHKNKKEDGIDFVKEACSKLHIEGDVLTNDIVSDYVALRSKTKDWKPVPKIPDVATVSIYKSLQQRSSISPSIIHIASVTRGDLKRVWKIQKSIEQGTEIKNYEEQISHALSPQDLILSKMGFIEDFKMTFSEDFKIMDNAIKESVETGTDFSARSIAATVMYLYLKCHKKQRCSAKMIASLFLTSPVSVYRYQNYLKTNAIQLFK